MELTDFLAGNRLLSIWHPDLYPSDYHIVGGGVEEFLSLTIRQIYICHLTSKELLISCGLQHLLVTQPECGGHYDPTADWSILQSHHHHHRT